MRILNCKVSNFASYKDLEFDFNDKGLCLVQGPTGSGKSTLCDIIPWVLFGRTAKNGTVDEILSWGTTEPTQGQITIETAHGTVDIVRIRGNKANDLYILKNDDKIRGVSLQDTQSLINETLGIETEAYLAGAYFHEFSQTAQFFTTSAKNRRTICEQLVDLSLPIKIQENLQFDKKNLQSGIATRTKEIDKVKHKISYLTLALRDEETKIARWDKEQQDKQVKLLKQLAFFEQEQASKAYKFKKDQEAKEQELLQQLSDAEKQPMHTDKEKCPTCGTTNDNKLKNYNFMLYLQKCLKDLKMVQNPYSEITSNTYQDQLTVLAKTKNPYIEGMSKMQKTDLPEAKADLAALDELQAQRQTELLDLELLADVVAAFRSTLIQRTIDAIEQKTNELLSEYFDAEITVKLEVEIADKIEALITKDGHQCSYTQLSKGQRQLLKLCFGVAVMKTTAQYQNVTFNQVFFDEATDGCDTDTKKKAFKLFQALALDYSSVFIVEHNDEIKSLADNSIMVELVNGESVIHE